MSEDFGSVTRQNEPELEYLRNMEAGDHVTVYCEDLDIQQNELVKTEDGWEVYTGFGRVEVDWEEIAKEVTHIV